MKQDLYDKEASIIHVSKAWHMREASHESGSQLISKQGKELEPRHSCRELAR
jgi:hypothetical protein